MSRLAGRWNAQLRTRKGDAVSELLFVVMSLLAQTGVRIQEVAWRTPAPDAPG